MDAMKTKEELNILKEEVETVSRKLHELTEEEMIQVIGGFEFDGLGYVIEDFYIHRPGNGNRLSEDPLS